MAANQLDEDELVDELLDDDLNHYVGGGSPRKRSHISGYQQQSHGKDTSSESSRPTAPAAADGGRGPAASDLADEAAAVFSRLSASSSGSPGGSKAAAKAAAAFAVGDGCTQPPGTIHPGGTMASAEQSAAQSAADLQRLHDRQWDWALAVHGTENAAMTAGWKPKDEPDYGMYSVYMARVRECLESPDVEDTASEAGARLLRMVLAFRAYMACLYASGTFVMEHRYSNLETLSQLGELTAEVASLSGGRQQTAYRTKAAAAAVSSAGSAAAGDASGADRFDGNSSGSQAAQEAAKGQGAGEAAAQPARSRRSESAPQVKGPRELAAAALRGGESPGGGGDGRRGRRSLDLDLKPLSDNSAMRPVAEKLKKAYRDRATMDVRPTIAAINFSREQRQELLQRRREVDAELERSQADRKTLLARLQMLTMRGGGTGQGFVLDASAALRANLDAEGRVITDFSSWFTCHLLTPLQHARCNATCYPYMPDVIGISDVLAAETQAA